MLVYPINYQFHLAWNSAGQLILNLSFRELFMAYLTGYHDKRSLYKIEGQSKPFIDKNLQLQIPEWESQQSSTYLYSPIYSHYAGSHPSSYLFPPINEAEIYQAMLDAENAYKGWKQTQQKITEVVKFNLQIK